MTNTAINPMEVMKGFSPEAARTYMQLRASIVDNPELAALLTTTNFLIGVGMASALPSGVCTLMWTKQAREAGVPDAGIVASRAQAARVTASRSRLHRTAPGDGGSTRRAYRINAMGQCASGSKIRKGLSGAPGPRSSGCSRALRGARHGEV